MSIEGDRGFVEALSNQCQDELFKGAAHANKTIGMVIINSIHGADIAGIINHSTAEKMEKALEGFKDRTFSQLSSADQERILSVFAAAINGDAESAYSSEIVDPYKRAKMSRDEVSVVLERQGELKTFIGAQLQLGRFIGLDHSQIPVRKRSDGSYELPSMTPMEEFIGPIKPEELTLTDRMPRTFRVDHWEHQRMQYINASIQGSDSIRVLRQEDADQLIEAIHMLGGKIALNKDYEPVLGHAMMLLSTQFIENGISTSLLLMARSLAFQGFEDFTTQVDRVDVRIEPVSSFFGVRQVNQFKVTFSAVIHTMHESLANKEVTAEMKTARKQLGIQPVLEGRVEGSLVCIATSPERVEMKEVKAKYFIVARQ